MATITLRLDDWTRDEVERLAQAQDTTISELLRSKINELLGKDVDMPRADAPRSMSLTQRRTLALLHEMLALLKPDEDDAAYHRRRIQVLESGFTAEYGDEYIAIGPELTPTDCSLVWDILDMFSVLESSVTRLSPDELAELGEDGEHALSFRGFDGNDARESRMLDYVKYLIDTRRWTNLAEHLSDAQEQGNSHMPVLATYQRMLRVFKPIWNSKLGRGAGREALDLSAAELRQVVDARRYPRDGE
jgi:uncharacterized protein YfbU (UPF0304 family)